MSGAALASSPRRRTDRTLRVLQRVMASPALTRTLGSLSPTLRLWHPRVRRDPYPLWNRMRGKSPLRMRLFGGWAVGRYADVERVLRDPAFSTNRNDVPLMKALEGSTAGAPDFRALLEHNLLMIDGAQHRRLRGLVSRAFTPKRVESLRPRLESMVDHLLDGFATRAQIDLVAELARPVPTYVIAELLGVPREDQERFHDWSEALIEILDPISGREGFEPPRRASSELAAYLRQLLAARRRDPRDDLLTAMAQADESGASLSEEELIALASLLLAAGNETTTNLIGNAVLLLQRHPGERRKLQDDPSLLPQAIEECLRCEPPVQFTDRAVVEPVELAGVRLEPGTIVAALLASANRDPGRFDEPDRFCITRRSEGHLAFGLGNHFCLGASLARLEAEVTLGALLKRYPDFRAAADAPAWKASVVLRGPASLPFFPRG